MRLHGTIPDLSEIHFEGRNDAMVCACGYEIRSLFTIEVPHDLYVFDMFVYAQHTATVVTTEETHSLNRSEQKILTPSPWGRLPIHGTVICPHCHLWQSYEFQFDGNRIVSFRDAATPNE